MSAAARRRRRLRSHPYGSAWKVAYADFTTAMMAVFIVLWLLTQADMRLRQQIAQYFRLPGRATVTVPGRPARATGRELPAPGMGEHELLEGTKRAIDDTVRRVARTDPDLASMKDQVISQVTDAGLAIQVVDRGGDMLFDPSSARLRPGAARLLRLIAGRLGRVPNRIQIGGHTDSRPFPADAGGITNWELAFARANAARQLLEGYGLWPGQVRRVVGYADTEPLVPSDPLAAENRRLSILVERGGPLPGTTDCAPGTPIVLPPDPLPEPTP